MDVIILSLLTISLYLCSSNAQGPPSPGYYPSSRVPSIGFNQCFRNQWGSEHQTLNQDSLTIWLDRSSGLYHKTSHFTYILILSYKFLIKQLLLYNKYKNNSIILYFTTYVTHNLRALFSSCIINFYI